MHKSRILFVINSLAGGGAERVFSRILRESVSRSEEYEIAVALLDQDPPAYGLPEHFTLFQLDARQSLIRSLISLRKTIDEFDPDLGVAFLTRANLATAGLMRLKGRPSIISERVNTAAHLSTGRLAGVTRAMVKWGYPMASEILAVSEGVRQGLIEDFAISSDKISVFYNPVDTQSIAESAKASADFEVRSSDIVAMGRLVPNKNFALAIRAFARSGWQGRLLILGEGPLREDLTALAEELGVADRVCLPGFVANPYAVLARAGLFLLSSNAEGFPNALVEAMALGLPCVATDCRSGPAEILRAAHPAPGSFAEGAGGLLVPCNDASAMAEAIGALCDHQRAAQFSQSGLQRVQDFSVARCVESLWQSVERQLPSER